MKLRLTEKQYDLLLEYIDEAKKPLVPQKLWSFFNKNPNATFFSVTKKNKDGSEKNFDFKLSKVKGKQTIEDLNQGNATKGCSTEVNFDKMIFGNQLILNFEQCKKRLTLNDITSIGLYDDEQSLKSKTPKDKFQIGGSSATPTASSGDTQDNVGDNSEELKQEAKKAMSMILNDPTLKKAFYTQPSLWNLFVAELKGEKATGKGIVPTLKIINNYENTSIERKLGSKFIEGETVTFTPVGTTKVPFIQNGKDDEYIFDENANVQYPPKVLPRKLGEGFKFIGQIQPTLNYEIEIAKRVNDKPDTFECRVTMIVEEGATKKEFPYNGRLTIKINKNQSPGYKPNESEEAKK